MRLLTLMLTLLALSVAKTAEATVRYASPSGTDPAGLSANLPGGLRAMVDSLLPGDTLYLAGGQYDQIKTLVVNKRASADKWVTICAADGEKPVIDFRQQPNGTNGVKVSGRYIHIKDITVRYAGKKGIWLENASYCLLERLDVYGCCDSGIQLRKGGYNVVVNCDSHDNFDYQAGGGNADGFADKMGGDAFPGNTYIGCRAWNNSDDGWDSFQRQTKDSPTEYMFCAAYNNGPAEFDLTQHPRVMGIDRDLPCLEGKDLAHFPNGGNPNGFKLGGQGKEEKASGNYTRHNTELKNCLAVGHRSKGFDQNNNAGEMKISHCLAFRNGVSYGFGNPYPCTLDIRHCISVEPMSGEHLAIAPECNLTQEDNSWNEDYRSSQTDGTHHYPSPIIQHQLLDSIDIVKVMLSRRESGGSLPEDLMKILRSL